MDGTATRRSLAVDVIRVLDGLASCGRVLRRRQRTPYQIMPPVVAKISRPRWFAASQELTTVHATSSPIHLKIARTAWSVSRYGWL